MATFIRVFCVFAVLVLLSLPALGQGQAPFVPGEVAVYATPDQLPGQAVIKFLPNAGISVVATQPGREFGLAQSLRASGFVAGLNLRAFAFETPNDPYYPYQWHLSRVQSDLVWGEEATGKGVTVAVLDTGLTPGGPDGIGCVKPGRNTILENDNTFDGDGHGTHVSGTIAQTTGNSVGVAGLAFEACVMPVKVLNDSGSGTFADIAEGIAWAVNNGAAVINMSLGTNARFGITNDPVMDPVLEIAYSEGVTVVCASGNDGNRSNVSYPAIYPTTIAVGATDYADKVTRYSNKGAGLDMVAPGGDSRDLNGDGYIDGVLQESSISGSWGYYFFTGTSMAAPHVAAAAAIVIGRGVATGPQAVFHALTTSALDIEGPGFDSTSGWGLLQAYNAVSGAAPIDFDEDGYSEAVDCNDNDPAINPGATEVCDDGIDNNCDGDIDEGCGDGGFCIDADGDGWCVEDGDCNDNDPHVYPGHNDTRGRWGRDGVDNDCNGLIDG